MKKILFIIDGQNFSEGAFDFVYQMHKMHPVLLTGVFLSPYKYSTMWHYGAGGAGGAMMAIPVLGEDDEEIINESVQKFETHCRHNDIDFRVHRETGGLSITELRKESRFADLMVISAEHFYQNMERNQPNSYLKEAIQHAECPVMLVPDQFKFPSNIILSYDGSRSSVYAIKQFTYLFPELCTRKTMLVYASDEYEDFPYQIYIEELAARHFSDLTLYRMKDDRREVFMDWLRDQHNPLLVSGALGRSGFSEIFSKSFITEVIRDHRTPVFIAHA